MSCKQIIFTEINKAELLDVTKDTDPLNEGMVRIKTAFNTISNGTEKANIMGNPNIGIYDEADSPVVFPRQVGYSSSGEVVEVGKNVTKVKVGDRVAMYGSLHCEYNILKQDNLLVLDDDVPFDIASMFYICTFPMAAVRKTKIELGESMIVMGLGTLGLLSVAFSKASGALPVIAVDPVKERREKALNFGADYALDPFAPNFIDEVKRITGGKGCNAAIEVTGLGSGLDMCLDCMAPFGRVSLLGCTRDRNFTIDYYRKVHGAGVTLIGAHTLARPKFESYPAYFTHLDDMRCAMNLSKYRSVDFKAMIDETHSPNECAEVFSRLVNDKNFPTVVQFDWSRI